MGIADFEGFLVVCLQGKSRCYHWSRCTPVLLFQPKYQLGHTENYMFLLSKKIFSCSKYTTNNLFDFEKRSTSVARWILYYFLIQRRRFQQLLLFISSRTLYVVNECSPRGPRLCSLKNYVLVNNLCISSPLPLYFGGVKGFAFKAPLIMVPRRFVQNAST